VKPLLRIVALVLMCSTIGEAGQAQLQGQLGQKATMVVRIEKNTNLEYLWLTDTKVIVTLPAGSQKALHDIKVIYDTKSNAVISITKDQMRAYERQKSQELAVKAQFQLWGTHRATKPPVPLIAQPPTNAFVEEAAVSPDHSLIVWILVTKSLKTDAPPNNHAPPTTGQQKPQVIKTRSIWISKVNGSGLHRLADIEVNDPLHKSLMAVSWLPNSKQIGFVYHDVLYTLAIQ